MPKFGWKPDLPEHVAQLPEMCPVMRAERFGARKIGSPRRENYDLLRYCTIRDQDMSSACVGFAVSGAAHSRLRVLGFDPEMLSALAPYAVGRQLEGIYKGQPLPDEGSHPFLVMSGGIRFGLPTEKAWPFDGDWVHRVRQEVPFDVFQKASQFRLTNVAAITVARSMRAEVCMQAIDAGHYVPLGMMVGNEFQAYRRGLGPVGVETENVGGHMTYLAGYEDYGEVFLGINSWSMDYGDNGIYRIHRSKLEHESTSDLRNFGLSEMRAA